MGGLKAGSADQRLEGLGALTVGPLGHEDMELLGGIDTDVHRKRPRVGALVIGGHGQLPARGQGEPEK
jgi:hypothetical protein